MRFLAFLSFLTFGCASLPHVHRTSPDPATAFWSKMKADRFDEAAGIASAAKLGSWFVGQAFIAAKRKAFSLRGIEGDKELLSWSHAGRVDRDALVREIAVACRYGPTQETAKLAVLDATELWTVRGDQSGMAALVEQQCPLDDGQMADVIQYAKGYGRYDLLKDIVVRAKMAQDDRTSLARDIASGNGCFQGVEFGLELGFSDDDLARVADSCDPGVLPNGDWSFRDVAQARSLFFAATRDGIYGLAFAVIPFAHPGHEDDATEFICQEAIRAKGDMPLLQLFRLVPKKTQRTMLGWFIEHGKARIAGWLTDEQAIEHRAFDKEIALGRYEDAAEIAIYGIELTFRKTGPLEAFHAAMKAKAFAAGRSLKYRFSISDDEYWKAYNDAVGSSPPPPAPPKRRPAANPCKETGDWEVKPCGK